MHVLLHAPLCSFHTTIILSVTLLHYPAHLLCHLYLRTASDHTRTVDQYVHCCLRRSLQVPFALPDSLVHHTLFLHTSSSMLSRRIQAPQPTTNTLTAATSTTTETTLTSTDVFDLAFRLKCLTADLRTNKPESKQQLEQLYSELDELYHSDIPAQFEVTVAEIYKQVKILYENAKHCEKLHHMRMEALKDSVIRHRIIAAQQAKAQQSTAGPSKARAPAKAAAPAKADKKRKAESQESKPAIDGTFRKLPAPSARKPLSLSLTPFESNDAAVSEEDLKTPARTSKHLGDAYAPFAARKRRVGATGSGSSSFAAVPSGSSTATRRPLRSSAVNGSAAVPASGSTRRTPRARSSNATSSSSRSTPAVRERARAMKQFFESSPASTAKKQKVGESQLMSDASLEARLVDPFAFPSDN